MTGRQSPSSVATAPATALRVQYCKSMKRIAILGSTGSIGQSTFKIVEAYPERFQVVAVAAGRNVDAAFEQVQRWRPKVVSVAEEKDADSLQARLKSSGITGIEVVHGTAGTVRVA